MTARAKRHRAQSGTTLIELLVATLILGLAVVLLVGLFSTGAIDSRLATRDTAAQAASQYELEKIGAFQYSANSAGYFDCFGLDGTVYGGSCPAAAKVRADVNVTAPQGKTPQLWTVKISSWPDAAPIGTAVSTYKVDR